MKEYKFVHLNKGLKFTLKKDLADAATVLNQYIADGWELKQVLSPNEVDDALIAVIYREV